MPRKVVHRRKYTAIDADGAASHGDRPWTAFIENVSDLRIVELKQAGERELKEVQLALLENAQQKAGLQLAGCSEFVDELPAAVSALWRGLRLNAQRTLANGISAEIEIKSDGSCTRCAFSASETQSHISVASTGGKIAAVRQRFLQTLEDFEISRTSNSKRTSSDPGRCVTNQCNQYELRLAARQNIRHRFAYVRALGAQRLPGTICLSDELQQVFVRQSVAAENDRSGHFDPIIDQE